MMTIPLKYSNNEMTSYKAGISLISHQYHVIMYLSKNLFFGMWCSHIVSTLKNAHQKQSCCNGLLLLTLVSFLKVNHQ